MKKRGCKMTVYDELQLERFDVKGFDSSKSVSVLCTEGTVWVTGGRCSADIILRAGQEISLIKGGRIVIEALSKSRALVCRHEGFKVHNAEAVSI